MIRRNARNARRPRMELLEDRRLMAGNVAVSLAIDPSGPDHLIITGDNNANQIEIAETAYTYVITPQDGTRINNMAPGQAYHQIKSHVTGDISINLGGGNDVLTVTGITTANDLVADLGSGDDDAVITDSTFKDDLKVFGGAGADLVRIDGVTVGGHGVNSGYNDLLVDLGENTTASSSDEVWISDTDVMRDLDLRLGNSAIKTARVEAGSTVGRDLSISSGVGAAFVDLIRSEVARDVTINTGQSNDFLTLDRMDVGRNLAINAGSGNNDVTLSGSTVDGNLGLNTGGGYDEVWLSETAINGRSNYPTLGGGNDTLDIRSTSARALNLDGGAGVDTLTIRDLALIGVLNEVSFEHRFFPTK